MQLNEIKMHFSLLFVLYLDLSLVNAIECILESKVRVVYVWRMHLYRYTKRILYYMPPSRFIHN